MVKGWRIAVALAALAAGCKTKEMKSTPFYEGDGAAYAGRAEDRVNLWPLAYWREPACSILWPLVSFGDDHFALRPLYSQYRQDGRDAPYDEYNVLWPFGQADFKSGDYTAFPFFWGKGYFAALPEVIVCDKFTAVLPLVLTESGGAIIPVAGWKSERAERLFTVFPLYSFSWTPERTSLWGACGLLGRSSFADGEYAHWALPFYLANRNGAYSIPWSRTKSFDGGDVVDAYMCGLGGRALTNDVYSSSWAVPFYYHDNERLLTPLFGKSSDSDWVMPLYYRDEHSFCTLACAAWDDPDTASCGFVAPPLLSWATWSTNSCRSSWGALAGLVGAKSNATGERRKSWALPFYMSDAGRSFHSLPYGWFGGGTPQTNTWWATRLVGTRAGRETGWWAFPLYDSSETIDFERCVDKSATSVGGSILWQCKRVRNSLCDHDCGVKTLDRETAEASLCMWLYGYERNEDFVSGACTSRHRVLWKLWDWRRSGGDVSLDAFPGFAYDSHSDGYVKASLAWRLFRYESNPAGGVAMDVLFVPVWR